MREATRRSPTQRRRGITGRLRYDAKLRSCITLCSAGRISESVNSSCQVLGLRSKRGKFDELISSRTRWPALNTLAVAHRSILNSYTFPATINLGSLRDSRTRARMIPSVRLRAKPHGPASTSLAVKSVSGADDDAYN